MRLALTLLAVLAAAQTPALKYEVASVKPSDPGARGGTGRPEPGGQRYRGTNLPLKSYISSAYQMKLDQVTGAPAWVDSDRFDIEAQAEKPSSLEEHHRMMQSLLAERFHLQFHMETKELPMYALTVDTSGAKLMLHDAANSGDPWIEQTRDAPFHARWKATASPMDLFAFRLAAIMDRPVVDQTGLKGNYDFTLTYTMDLPANAPPNFMLNGEPVDTTGPTIYQAVRQQLGLRLEARKGPVKVMVIDHVERPAAN
ncbi:MAG TPA: TIGR03435 family protein [Candidatus Sulfopaludibacter sp.]|jgi:uncharacterized protein (TIGR03435 family)|nr:TIGR03435 family protein [Candidatus Sulfopaludibacter sp.]